MENSTTEQPEVVAPFTPVTTVPASPTNVDVGFIPLVTVVGFHHARGPEVENWFGAEESEDPAIDHGWLHLPFMALSDGAHASTEDFSYFTLLRPATATLPATSLFGISCTHQMDATLLHVRPADVTRSTVQKAVVVIADSPQFFGLLRERLGVVTKAWFAQRDFTDVEILKRFQESLKDEKERGVGLAEEDREEYLGMSLRELVREFKWQTLLLFKCCLLQHKMLFFGTRCERLCMMQFSLISLIPGLIRNLQDCADPDLDSFERQLVKPTSLKTSDRHSLLTYMGLPLQIFGKGSLFGPYTPLQQLDVLADVGTKSYIVGSTNSLLLQQRDRYSDILINLDEMTINITSSSLRAALSLSVADRRWIDFITQSVNDTWDDANPSRPKTMGYVGSEEFIRLQFEEYLLSLLSSVKCHNYMIHHANNPKVQLPQVEGDPAYDFGTDWIEAWSHSENYRIWDRHTESHLFDIVEPKHPCAGGLTIDDVQRRMMEQVKEYHLDERFAVGKEVIGRNLQAGKEKASTVFNKIYADMEAMREAQRRKAEEQKREAEKNGSASPGFQRQDGQNGAKQTVQSVGSKAGAYLGSWGTWASEKRKTGWGRSTSGGVVAQPTTILQKKENTTVLPVRSDEKVLERPRTQDSYEEAIFDAEVHAKHVVDGQITKVDIPLGSPGLSDDGHIHGAGTSTGTDASVGVASKRLSSIAQPSRFHEQIDSPVASSAAVWNEGLPINTAKPRLEAAGLPTPVSLPAAIDDTKVQEPRPLTDLEVAAVQQKEDSDEELKAEEEKKRKSVRDAVEVATATPISP